MSNIFMGVAAAERQGRWLFAQVGGAASRYHRSGCSGRDQVPALHTCRGRELAWTHAAFAFVRCPETEEQHPISDDPAGVRRGSVGQSTAGYDTTATTAVGRSIQLTVRAAGYRPVHTEVTLPPTQTLTLDLSLEPLAQTVVRTEKPKTPVHRRWWLWTGVGVAAAVVATGLVLRLVSGVPMTRSVGFHDETILGLFACYFTADRFATGHDGFGSRGWRRACCGVDGACLDYASKGSGKLQQLRD